MGKKLFDYVIGNPPYQEEQDSDDVSGSKKNYAPPVYNAFMDAAYVIAERTELIHPARFLFNAGSTPKNWNEKMLADEHFKVLKYEPDSNKVFPGLTTPIKGGIAITYHDSKKKFGAVGAFNQYEEVNSIAQKVIHRQDFQSLMNIVYSRTSYRPISQSVIEEPDVGNTETFISIGKFETKQEAIDAGKYISTKFARTLLSILKVTQNGNKPVWKMIPLQDFTPSSDIDWSKSVHEIDLQLYRKYGLDEDEINFIETHVKEMT